jgi:hypothetical protein
VSETVKVAGAMSDIPRAAWDALVDADPEANPLVSWAWLEALEHAGCASPRLGWAPRHLTLWRGDTLVAAAPAYLKADSDGDFSRDWHIAEFALRSGFRYYPKLVVTVPYTPVGGRRFLVAPGEDRARAVAALLGAARLLAREERLGGVHVLFPIDAEAAELEDRHGMARRRSIQFHWVNRGYTDYEDWLRRALDAKRRHQARRERAAAAGQGITIRTVRGAEIAADPGRWATTVHGFYRSTIDKLMWGRPWLNLAFYKRIFANMPGALEVVAAEREGRFVAGAFNVASRRRLFGRYWGCHEEHAFLHFNVCLYHSIDDCIRRGLEVFEGGAGGEHKMSRGFDPTETHATIELSDARLDRVVRDHLKRQA